MTARLAALPRFVSAVCIAGLALACHSHQISDGQPTAPRYLHVLIISLMSYDAQYKTFPASLAALGPTQRGGISNADTANLVDATLASGVCFGYVFHYVPTKPTGKAKFVAFTITAEPVGSEASGRKHYFADDTGVIRAEADHTATAASRPID
jgi:hypothetical protein